MNVPRPARLPPELQRFGEEEEDGVDEEFHDEAGEPSAEHGGGHSFHDVAPAPVPIMMGTRPARVAGQATMSLRLAASMYSYCPDPTML